MKKILVIDDDQAVLNYLNIMLLQSGLYDVETLNVSTDAYKKISDSNYDLLLLDMDMPEVSGLDILKFIKEQGIHLPALILTGVEDVQLAVSAMKWGAIDYLTKPIENDFLLSQIASALERGGVQAEKAEEPRKATLDELKHKEAFSEIITQNREMIRIFQMVEKMAGSDNSVLIWGESGTGKELIAKAIHMISERRNEKFIAVNAGSFANELFSSEFFGHDKGAFTGAVTTKKGFLEEANKGTLFLDEIGELTLPIQVKLLRVLQEGEFFRLGSTQKLNVDVRIIAATNKNLLEEIKKGNFRKDLFYRLNMNSVYLPPLRDRKDDIPLLCFHFLKKFSLINNKNVSRISASVMKMLKEYDYPGNIRELINIINSTVIIESSEELRKKSLPHYFLESTAFSDINLEDIPLKSLKEIEKDHILKIAHYTRGNKTKASKILGISRISLISKMKQYKEE